MTRVVWTPEAVADLEAIESFIARDSVHYSKRVVEQLIEAVDRLQDFPQSGRVVPERDQPELREVIHGPFRIVYRLSGDSAQILTVFRGSRLLPLP